MAECQVKHTSCLDMGTHKRPRVSREQGAALASTVPLDLTKKWLLPHLNLHDLAEYACLGRAYPELTLDARILAADRLVSNHCSPCTVRQADDRLHRVYSGCYLRERRIMGYIEYLAVVRPCSAWHEAYYQLMLSKWEGPPVSAAVLACIEAALDASRSLDEASFLDAEAEIVDLYVILLEKRVCNDNPDLGRDQVLRRCARDAKFASGEILVDALFRFGLHMGHDDIRDAYLEALDGQITDANMDGASSPLAAAWLDLLLRQRTTAAAWRESGCALVDIVDCMLAAVEASMGILQASERASE